MSYLAPVSDSIIDVTEIRDLLVQGSTAFPVIQFSLDPSLTGLNWTVRGTFMLFNAATLSSALAKTEGSTAVTVNWPVGSNFTTLHGEMQIVLIGANALGTVVVKATGYVNVQRDFSISTVDPVDENLIEQLMATIPASVLSTDQTAPQTILNGIPLLESSRVIDDDNQLVDKKFVIDSLPTIPDHNDLDGLQGGAVDEYYHVTAAEKTVIENTSGANTGDQDLSGYQTKTGDIAYAGIHTFDNVTAQSIPTGGYTKMTAFMHNGEAANCTPDQANDKITITKAGRYQVSVSISAGSGTNNVTFKFAAFLGGAEQHQVHAHRKFGTAGDLGNCGMVGIINAATVPVDLDIRARHDNVGSINLTTSYASVNVVYLGA